MADTKTNEAKISIKVIVDKVKKRVVYAVADHTFVDILFSFMTLPMGTIVRLLGKLDDTKFDVLGSLNNLYQSLKDLPECYFATHDCKFMLLNPRSLSFDYCRYLKLAIDDTEPVQSDVCENLTCRVVGNYRTVSGKIDKVTCLCSQLMSVESLYWYHNVRVLGGVFVSGIATFIITDDLCVEPYTSASSIRLLTDFGITDINNLEERNIEMSSHLVLQLLKMALSIDYPLTHLVFSEIHNYTRELVGSGQDISFDQFDLLEKETSASSKMVLEVSLQKSTGKLLVADAKEDFVEFLFGFLSIPLGTVVGTLTNGASSISCMDNIFKSISNMCVKRYLRSQDMKDMLLKPHIGQKYPSKHQVFTLSNIPPLSIQRDQRDPRKNGGQLRQRCQFMVTDDLTITPSSSFSALDILKKFGVLPEDIEKCEVSIGLKEGLSMLKASLRSCSTLTTSLEHQLNNLKLGT